MAGEQLDGRVCLGKGTETAKALPYSDGLQPETKPCQDRNLQSQIDDVRLLVKGLDGELRASESRQVMLNRRLAEACGRLNGFQEEHTLLDGRMVAVEAGQRTLASSTQQALRVAATLQQQQDEAEVAACLDSLSRRDPLPTTHLPLGRRSPHRRLQPALLHVSGTEDFYHLSHQEQQPEPEGEAQSQADQIAAALPLRQKWNSNRPRLWPTRRRSADARMSEPALDLLRVRCFEFETDCRKELMQQGQQLVELDQVVAKLLSRPCVANTKGTMPSMQVQSRLDEQGVLLEQLDARIWAVAEGQTRLENQAKTPGCGEGERVEKVKFDLVSEGVSKLQSSTEKHGKELRRVRAQLDLLSLIQSRRTPGDMPAGTFSEAMAREVDAPSESRLTETSLATAAKADTTAAADRQCSAAGIPLAIPGNFSDVVQRLEVRLDAACAGITQRCDELQKVVDQHLQKACDWLPAVEGRVEQLAAQCQDCIMRTEAQEMQTRGLRAEHDASCRQLLVLADQVACMVE